MGQWTFQQHLNYTFNGRKEPDFPGGLVPNHSLNGTPEWAYGMTEWWEIGSYLPFAVSGSGAFLSNGAKVRSLFAVPHAGERNFFYGINLELSYETPPFSQTRFASEIRPIVGRLIAKAIIGYDFPVPGSTNKSNGTSLKPPLVLKARPRQSGLDDLGPGFAFITIGKQSFLLRADEVIE